jgi:hypothetical protein
MIKVAAVFVVHATPSSHDATAANSKYFAAPGCRRRFHGAARGCGSGRVDRWPADRRGYQKCSPATRALSMGAVPAQLVVVDPDGGVPGTGRVTASCT